MLCTKKTSNMGTGINWRTTVHLHNRIKKLMLEDYFKQIHD
jgi:hypothetical protein